MDTVLKVLQNRSARKGGHGVQVMFDVTKLLQKEHTMTKGQNRAATIDVKARLERDEDFLRAAVEALVQAVLEAL